MRDAEHDVWCGNSSHELDRFMVWSQSVIEKFFSILVHVWRIDTIDRCVTCVIKKEKRFLRCDRCDECEIG